jgi:hypothetical protein
MRAFDTQASFYFSCMRPAHRCLDGENPGGGRARRSPICAKCLWRPKKKEREKKNFYSRKSVSVWFDGANKKIPEARRRLVRFFFYSLLIGPKAFHRPQQKTKGGLWFIRPMDWRVCSLYIEDALPSTSHCTCRLNNVHTCQQITNHSHMLFSLSSSFHPRPPRKTISQS